MTKFYKNMLDLIHFYGHVKFNSILPSVKFHLLLEAYSLISYV